ncbi:MAG: CDF family Co(II)/Ni(II) efflux transporter DmeF [Fibrobacteria bacterium]|nr:CDF family Co(II)/Ni(II) efflux transporter DmeF [Fibrobacteria bacterium]
MPIHSVENWKHEHNYFTKNEHGELRTKIVAVITVIMMGIEIIGGIAFGSMALLADGWHMGTHVAAFGITLFAYWYANKYAKSSKFSFGTGKVIELGGFASAIALAVVALVMAVESVIRIIEPQNIKYNEAIIVAVIGLLINGFCALMLKDSHHDHHGHHDHHHQTHKEHHHQDNNLKAAYFHVLADALTSVLAILGLFTAKFFNWVFMDALMGIVGALIITKWAWGLLRVTSPTLLDIADQHIKEDIISHIESDADNKISDLHIWPLNSEKSAAIISLVTHCPQPPQYYQKLVSGIRGLTHITIEVNHCEHEQPIT